MSGIIEGPLSKWTNVMKGWQYRWFGELIFIISVYISIKWEYIFFNLYFLLLTIVLDDNAGLLSYYTVNICLNIACFKFF